VGSLAIRLNVAGDGATLPSFSILTDAVVDPTYHLVHLGGFDAVSSADLISLTAPEHYNGAVAVSYAARDEEGTASTNSATDVVNVAPRLVPIRAADDAFALVQGHSVTFTLDQLLANDRDDNGDAFRMTSITQPAHGTLVVTLAHDQFAPPAALVSTTTGVFSATLADGSALPTWMVLDTATGIVTANPPLDVLGTYGLVYTLTDGASTATASASYAIDGNVGVSFTYTPDTDFVGNESLTYTLTDDRQAPVTAKVALTVAPALVAGNDRLSMNSDASLSITAASLLANDVSADHRTLTITSGAQPDIGSLAFDGTTIVYTAPHYADGKATFQYTVSDDEGHSEVASVTIAITSIDHAPDAPVINLTGEEDSLSR
jgi:hypothetical protein